MTNKIKLYIWIFILCILFIRLARAEPWPVDPTNQVHEIWHSYGQAVKAPPQFPIYFHEGLDFIRPNATFVRAIHAGMIVDVPTQNFGQNPYTNFIVINDTGNPHLGWEYGHILPANNTHVYPQYNWTRGDIVNQGDIIGIVWEHAGTHSHLHFGRVNDNEGWNGSLTGADGPQLEEDPLLLLTPKDDNTDPFINENFYYRPNSQEGLFNPTYFEERNCENIKVVQNNIDIIINASDKFAFTPSFPFENVTGIQNIKFMIWDVAGNPLFLYQTLVNFDDRFVIGYNQFRDPNFARVIYEDNNILNIPDTGSDGGRHILYYIITNNDGDSTNKINPIDSNRYWNTNVKKNNPWNWDDSVEDRSASENAEAEYSDGEYTVDVRVEDEAGNHETVTRKVIVNNFNEFVESNKDLYVEGETLNIIGSGYLPNLNYWVYVFNDRDWTECGQLSLLNPVKSKLIKTDGNGYIPMTPVWTNMPWGQYDIVVDYDHDGNYTPLRLGKTVDAIDDKDVVMDFDCNGNPRGVFSNTAGFVVKKCGNSKIEPVETCDPPAVSSIQCPIYWNAQYGWIHGICDNQCCCQAPEYCGNRIVVPPEQCDPPGTKCTLNSYCAGIRQCGDPGYVSTGFCSFECKCILPCSCKKGKCGADCGPDSDCGPGKVCLSNCKCAQKSKPKTSGGPNLGRKFIYFYSGTEPLWLDLGIGRIDITDWSLTKSFFDMFLTPPYSDKISIFSYGAESKIFMLEINNNNNQYLGNPPNSTYPNPVYPNPTSVKEMRQAIAYLVNRNQLEVFGGGMIIPIYTPVSPYMGMFVHPEIRPGGTLEALTYPYSRTSAEAALNAGGFPIGFNGWRYWDQNKNGVKDPGEDLNLKFFIRSEDSISRYVGDIITEELRAVHINVNSEHVTEAQARQQVMTDKNFNLYIGYHKPDVDPDYFINWNWNYYLHPGIPNNYAGVNDAIFNGYSNKVRFAKSVDEAETNALLAQERFATLALGIPLWTYNGNEAMYRNYTGGTAGAPVTPDDGENQYRDETWEEITNIQGTGINNYFTYAKTFPKLHDCDNMTMRLGLSTNDISSLNPIYASLPNEWDILKGIYESLIVRDPNNLGELKPWLAESYEVGNYTNPKSGYKNTKIKFKLRPGITWHDGTPLTIVDVYFTLVELPRTLQTKGLPLPSWMSNVANISDFEITDPYNFEVLFDNSSIFAPSWLSRQIILPKHIWKPIVESGNSQTFAPDPNMIGSGPWRLKDYAPLQYIQMVANSPNDTVQTNLAGSKPITSPRGYWDFNSVTSKITMDIKVDGTNKAKIDYNTQPHTVIYTIHNLYNDSITGNIYISNPDILTEIPNTVIAANELWTYSWTGGIKGNKNEASISIDITSPLEFAGALKYNILIWSTIREDITGSTYYDDIGLSTYPYKSKLPSPDCKVDARDVALVSSVFGSYPGHSNWNPFVDINGDYKIDARDVAAIASKFGWRC